MRRGRIRRRRNTHISVFHGSCHLLEGFPPGDDGHPPFSEVVLEQSSDSVRIQYLHQVYALSWWWWRGRGGGRGLNTTHGV